MNPLMKLMSLTNFEFLCSHKSNEIEIAEQDDGNSEWDESYDVMGHT